MIQEFFAPALALASGHWQLGLIPIISATIGWGTNVLAYQMMFYPVYFVGIPPLLGWRGVVPANGKKMAGIAVQMMLENLVSPEEIIDRFDPDKTIEYLESRIRLMIEEVINEVMSETIPVRWELLPTLIKRKIYDEAYAAAPQFAQDISEDIKDNLHELIDFEKVMTDALTENPELLNHLFQSAGARAFGFFKKSGVFFGFLFGLPCMLAWSYLQTWWILPLCGFFVGYVTNVLALKMIFTPLHPKKLGPLTIQALFVKDQPLVSQVFAQVISSEVLNSQRITTALLDSPAARARIQRFAERHINRTLDTNISFFKPYLMLSVGSKEYIEIKRLAVLRLLDNIGRPMQHSYEFADQAMDIEDTLRERILTLPPEKFEKLLHPIFEEDEIYLVLAGGVVGSVAGWVQYIVLS